MKAYKQMFSRSLKRVNRPVNEENRSSASNQDKNKNMESLEFDGTGVQDGHCDYPVPGGPYATSSMIVRFLYRVSSICITPWCLVLDYFLSMFIHTTDDSSHTSRNLFYFCIKAFLTLIVLLCFTLLALLAFIIWFPLQLFRPRSYSFIGPRSDRRASEKYERIAFDNSRQASPCVPLNSIPQSSITTYSVLSGNLCLMPEFIAHINNLSNTVSRGKKMATYLCGEGIMSPQARNQRSGEGPSKPDETDFLVPAWSAETLNIEEGYETIAGDSIDSRSVTSTLWSITSKERTVSDVFPGPFDFLCLQEVFDSRATDQLIEGLKTKYPYIIYDVAWPVHSYRMTLLGSGLCIASRHPFIDIEFKAYPDGNRDDKLACKGVLMTKVFLGKTVKGEDRVGYLATTHLQAWSHSNASSARCKQLNSMENWMEDFYQNSRKRDNDASEVVMFNVITGDFNFDKASHFDKNEQACSFFQNFNDPCIDETGAQHSWVVGTELNQKKMHDDQVRTPHGLQRMLVSELERCQYVSSTIPTKSSLQRVGDGKRRIDYILYKECEPVNLTVKDYKFFTGLATLTDHIPVGMTFSCEQQS